MTERDAENIFFAIAALAATSILVSIAVVTVAICWRITLWALTS